MAPRPGTAGRSAAVVGLLVLAAVGLHSGGAPAAGGGTRAGGTGALQVLAAAGGALLVLCGAMLVRELVRELRGVRAGLPRGPVGARRRPRVLRQVLAVSLLGAVLLTPTGSRLLARLGDHLHSGSPPAAARQHPAAPRPGTSARPRALAPAAGAGAALAAAGLLIGALLLRRRRPSPVGTAADEPSAELSAAVAAAATELARPARGPADPRRRVIACYAAMERVLAAAGTPRRPVDTPGELLRRAEAAGAVAAEPAAVLTELFRRARFGVDPMTGDDLDRARAALAALAAPVRSPAGAGRP